MVMLRRQGLPASLCLSSARVTKMIGLQAYHFRPYHYGSNNSSNSNNNSTSRAAQVTTEVRFPLYHR